MKKLNGNIWNMTSCNRLVAERIDVRRHEKHLRALESTRGMVDASTPKEQPHLRSKPKTRKLQEDRAAEIQLENRILLQKMLNIDTKASQFSGESAASNRVQPRSLNGEAQRREQDRIIEANQGLLKRLQNAKPSIDPRAWEDEEVDRQALKFRVSQNASRGRVANLPVPQLPQRAVSERLPRIGGRGSGHGEDWSDLTNTELDRRLRELEDGPGRHPALTPF